MFPFNIIRKNHEFLGDSYNLYIVSDTSRKAQNVISSFSFSEKVNHPAVQALAKQLDLQHTFGFIKLVAFPAADTPGVNAMTAAEITTGMPQGSTSTPGRAFINSSSVALSGDPTPNDVTAPDASKEFTGNLMDTAVPGEDFDPAGSSIPQVISFDDVASIVHERSEGQDPRRLVFIWHRKVMMFLKHSLLLE